MVPQRSKLAPSLQTRRGCREFSHTQFAAHVTRPRFCPCVTRSFFLLLRCIQTTCTTPPHGPTAALCSHRRSSRSTFGSAAHIVTRSSSCLIRYSRCPERSSATCTAFVETFSRLAGKSDTTILTLFASFLTPPTSCGPCATPDGFRPFDHNPSFPLPCILTNSLTNLPTN